MVRLEAKFREKEYGGKKCPFFGILEGKMAETPKILEHFGLTSMTDIDNVHRPDIPQNGEEHECDKFYVDTNLLVPQALVLQVLQHTHLRPKFDTFMHVTYEPLHIEKSYAVN